MKYKTGTWSKEDELFLIENYGKMTVEEVSQHIKRSAQQIHNKTRRLREKGHKIGGSEEVARREYEFIRENIEKPTKEIAEILGVNVPSLYKRIREIKKEPEVIAKLKAIEKLKQEKITERNRKRSRERYWKQIREEIDWEKEKARKEKEAEELQAMYKKIINEPITDGVFKSNLKVKLGKSYRTEKVKGRISKSDDRPFTGKLIHETKDHLTLKNKTRAESFLKVDFLTGEYEIKEVS